MKPGRSSVRRISPPGWGAVLAGARMPFSEAARVMGERGSPKPGCLGVPRTNRDGRDALGRRAPARIWNVPAPDMEPHEARLELARRYLHVFGPATPNAFATWAGIRPVRSVTAFAALDRSLTPVRTPIGEAWILERGCAAVQRGGPPTRPGPAPAERRSWFLLQGADRELLVPEERHRRALWTSRVWPGALLVDGEIVGTWRRAGM